MFKHPLINPATLEHLKLRLTHGVWRCPTQTAGIMTQTRLSMTPTDHSLMSANVLATTRRRPRDTPRLHNLSGVNASRSLQNTLITLLHQSYSTHTQSLARTRARPQPQWRHRVLLHNPCTAPRRLCSNSYEILPSPTRGTCPARNYNDTQTSTVTYCPRCTLPLLRIRRDSLPRTLLRIRRDSLRRMLVRSTRSTIRGENTWSRT
jgi:hypothetical protein